MLFNSYAFLFLYLPAVFAGMFWIGRHSHRLAALWLALASLMFYAVWDARFVLLLLASVAFNYGAGYWIGLRRAAGQGAQARHFLVVAIAANLGLLGYFKYANFFLASASQFWGGHFAALDIILPLGISFFTFTQIAFLVDVHRGFAREYNFIHYLLFVTYFPHLIAGPILHHKQMMPQFAEPETYRINWDNVAAGMTLFIFGLAKKVLIADNLAEYATPVFDAVKAGGQPMLFEAWIGALSYTLQLYFDFSGYSDMAIGLSLMFNVRLPINFNSPYQATSVIEFWRRWHITLSVFLRDYLYIPLGGNRKGSMRRHANLTATALLGGLWHGASWTFVAWGGLHGCYLVINHAWRNFKLRRGWGDGGRWARLGAGALTFLSVVVGWVFFRADSFASAATLLHAMAGMNGISLSSSLEPWLGHYLPERQTVVFLGVFPLSHLSTATALACLLPSLALVWGARNAIAITQRLHERPHRIFTPLALGSVFGMSLLAMRRVSEFLYFQF